MRSTLLAALALAVAGAAAAPLELHARVMEMPKLPAGRELPPSSDGWSHGSIKMPFAGGGEPGVAGRINDALFLEELGFPAPAEPGASFVAPADQLPEGTTSLEFTSSVVRERVLSVRLNGEGCGAYCENFALVRSFDLRDGRLLLLADLLTPAGVQAAARRVDAERKRRYQAQIRELKAGRAKLGKKAGPEETEDFEQRIDLNEMCLKDLVASPTSAESLGWATFEPHAQGGLVLTVGRCSNHATRALDDVDEVATTIAPADLKPMLTPYGRALLQGDGDAPAPARVTQRVLRGKLGSAAVTMRLGEIGADGTFSGVYFYDRYRKSIALDGRRQGDRLEATEKTDSAGRFALSPRAGGLAGTWQDKGGRKLPVTLD